MNQKSIQNQIGFNTKSFAFNTVENKDRKQTIVFEAFKKLGESSDLDIATYLGWTSNRVIPRRAELLELGKLELVGVKIGVYNKPVKTYKLKDNSNT
ncbi:MAG: hypothetical protein V4608_10825 [Bacteroidota bacterium]